MQSSINSEMPDPCLTAHAVVFERPESLQFRQVELTDPAPGQALVDVEWTGISTGTEKMLWSGTMPPFPGMGYPLVPGYETVGRIAASAEGSSFKVGDRVFVSGASCFRDLRGLFGGAASRLVVDEQKLIAVDDGLEQDAILMALAATAHHALVGGKDSMLPDLIVGHGVLGRLLARLTIALGGSAPAVWETNKSRNGNAGAYAVIHPDDDDRRDYRCIVDASGDASILDALMPRLARRGEIVLAGFYSKMSFDFPPAFMREASIRIAAEFEKSDLRSVRSLVGSQALSLDALITHTVPASEAGDAYPTAFGDPACLKMVLDWRSS